MEEPSRIKFVRRESLINYEGAGEMTGLEVGEHYDIKTLVGPKEIQDKAHSVPVAPPRTSHHAPHLKILQLNDFASFLLASHSYINLTFSHVFS